MNQNKTLAAQQKDAVLQASIDFIATLTGMKAPPIEVVPPAPVGDAAMPVAAWIQAGATLPDRKGWETCAEGRGFAVVRQSDALAALAAKDAEIARLESAWQVNTMRRKDGIIAAQETQSDKLRAELAVMTAERDAMAKNAARYVWLREIYSGSSTITEKDGFGGRMLKSYESLDAAIDAEIAKLAQK